MCQFNIANNVNSINTCSHGTIDPVPYSLFLVPTTPDEVQKIINVLPLKYSAGVDEIPSVVVRRVSEMVSVPLCLIINRCFESGVFSDRLKVAKVVPVHKKGDSKDITNYRPVSVLPIFSKVFERVIYNRLLDYFLRNNLFYINQHGFIPKRLTITSIFQSVNFVLDQLDKKQLVSGVYFDLSKAFDLVNHELLLQKLEYYGVRGIANDLIKSYLGKRKMTVCIKSENKVCFSRFTEVKSGVPQGSVFGPILFVIFTNDLNKKINLTSLYQFADDTSCIVSSSDTVLLSDKTHDVVGSMLDWCNENSLKLNTDKTSLILFKNADSEPLNVTMNGQSIDRARSVKFLGIILDQSLVWTEQVNDIICKMNSAAYAVRLLSHQVSRPVLRTFYMASVQSILSYSIMFWYRSSVEHANRIFIAQKRIVRLMSGIHFRETCRGKFRLLNIMTVPSLFIYTCVLFVKSNVSFFIRNIDVSNNLNTRGQNNLSVPIHRTALYDTGPMMNCVKVYNSLPQEIREIQGVDAFRRHLKEYLISKEFYSLQDYFDSG